MRDYFYGRWADVPRIKTKKGRCSFCRKPGRKVATMEGGHKFCGSCYKHVLEILRNQPDILMNYPHGGTTWEGWVNQSRN